MVCLSWYMVRINPKHNMFDLIHTAADCKDNNQAEHVQWGIQTFEFTRSVEKRNLTFKAIQQVYLITWIHRIDCGTIFFLPSWKVFSFEIINLRKTITQKRASKRDKTRVSQRYKQTHASTDLIAQSNLRHWYFIENCKKNFNEYQIFFWFFFYIFDNYQWFASLTFEWYL